MGPLQFNSNTQYIYAPVCLKNLWIRLCNGHIVKLFIIFASLNMKLLGSRDG